MFGGVIFTIRSYNGRVLHAKMPGEGGSHVSIKYRIGLKGLTLFWHLVVHTGVRVLIMAGPFPPHVII